MPGRLRCGHGRAERAQGVRGREARHAPRPQPRRGRGRRGVLGDHRPPGGGHRRRIARRQPAAPSEPAAGWWRGRKQQPEHGAPGPAAAAAAEGGRGEGPWSAGAEVAGRHGAAHRPIRPKRGRSSGARRGRPGAATGAQGPVRRPRAGEAGGDPAPGAGRVERAGRERDDAASAHHVPGRGRDGGPARGGPPGDDEEPGHAGRGKHRGVPGLVQGVRHPYRPRPPRARPAATDGHGVRESEDSRAAAHEEAAQGRLRGRAQRRCPTLGARRRRARPAVPHQDRARAEVRAAVRVRRQRVHDHRPGPGADGARARGLGLRCTGHKVEGEHVGLLGPPLHVRRPRQPPARHRPAHLLRVDLHRAGA